MAHASLPSPQARAVPRGPAFFKGKLLRTRDPGVLRNRKKNGGAQSDSGAPLISPTSNRIHSPVGGREEEGTKRKRKVRQPLSAARLHPACTCSLLRSPPQPLPRRHAARIPLPPHPEALQPPRAPGGSLRLLDCTPEGRTRDCSEQPRRLNGGQEGQRNSSSSVSLTQTPPGSAAPLPVTGRC